MARVKTNKISKEKFIEVYNKHKPNKYISFAYKYILSSKNNTISINKNIIIPLIILFMFGFIDVIFNLNSLLVKYSTILFACLLFIIGIYLLSVTMLNNFRIRKICKELNITINEYTKLVNEYDI